MSKCGRKKYMRTNVRQMTMETVESQQDRSVTHSVAEHSSAHMQTGQISVPTLAQVSVAGSGTGRGSPAVTLVQLPSGQTVQVQGVIQTPHPSVIQSPQIQTVQVATIAETDDSADSEVIDSHKRREILSRRPSYRKILNELSSDVPGIPKIEEEKSEEEGTPPNIATMAVPTSIYQTSTGQYNEETDLAPSHMAAATGDMPTYQIRAPTTALPQGVVMAASPGSLHSPQQLAEEATRKRELRLMKNREAARECRRKKKEYVKCLENRVAVLENQNKTLIEELKALKDLYCHKAE
ncbi:cAMP-responsive element modulator isoform X7 [Arvicanthis niloticus]|uniref:cAMP-responsive element modulator n=1 Tax=Rattus norvegicus TaxID=10116 RepID=A0A0G2JYV9_RAT|nr:cAMP-responsive element modulator isoform X9 [Rattus norvegicus]XP_032740206.1 cAMP-responsive element modulator isoform X9 [Rattus rattus]XP_034366029.1 cAMP-responsive element modulator isoform X3 [Arvicanthis niloticus]|eukprot:XP_006254119.1 PREDICTED: cAMP-responsive element modulator isoform X9 [Rattus norvegicus]